MPRKAGMKHLQISLSGEARDKISDFAKRHGYKVTADYLRKLIEDDMAAHGKTVDFGIERGGDRRSGTANDTDD